MISDYFETIIDVRKFQRRCILAETPLVTRGGVYFFISDFILITDTNIISFLAICEYIYFFKSKY